MIEFTAEVAGRVAQRALFDEWRQLIAAGLLTREGLMAVRGRLIAGAEFRAGAELELMQLVVDEAVAAALGVEVGDMPGRAPMPDDASGID